MTRALMCHHALLNQLHPLAEDVTGNPVPVIITTNRNAMQGCLFHPHFMSIVFVPKGIFVTTTQIFSFSDFSLFFQSPQRNLIL